MSTQPQERPLPRLVTRARSHQNGVAFGTIQPVARRFYLPTEERELVRFLASARDAANAEADMMQAGPLVRAALVAEYETDMRDEFRAMVVRQRAGR